MTDLLCFRSRHARDDEGSGAIASLLSSIAQRASGGSNDAQSNAEGQHRARDLVGALDIDALTKHFERVAGGDREMDRDVRPFS